MITSPHLLFISAIALLTGSSVAISWLGFHRLPVPQWLNETAPCHQLARRHGLARRQQKLCTRYSDVMQHVHAASVSSVALCQRLFSQRRWNCSSVREAPRFGRDLTAGTREQAFVYAAAAAALVHAVARACGAGGLFYCGCGAPPARPSAAHFKWGGCGDNAHFGRRFARMFADASQRRMSGGGASKRRMSVDGASKRRMSVDGTSQRRMSGDGTSKRRMSGDGASQRRMSGDGASKRRMSVDGASQRRMSGDGASLRRVMRQVNLHNSKAGRKVVVRSLDVDCKCHGVSGSCSLKTCWRALPSLLDIGLRLQRKYNNAIEVTSRRIGSRKQLMPANSAMGRFGEGDLIYSAKSPDYCLQDDSFGSLGTRGRLCNMSSPLQDGCSSMCCGRPVQTQRVLKSERCHCKYVWCCKVECKTCTHWHQEHRCT